MGEVEKSVKPSTTWNLDLLLESFYKMHDKAIDSCQPTKKPNANALSPKVVE